MSEHMINVRGNSIARLQKKFPQWSRVECEVQADKLIAEVLADREPTNEDKDESEVKAKIKKTAGL